MRATSSLLGLGVLMVTIVTTSNANFCTGSPKHPAVCKRIHHVSTAHHTVLVQYAWCRAYEQELHDRRQKTYFFKAKKDRVFKKADTCQACMSIVHQGKPNPQDEGKSERFLAAKQFILNLKGIADVRKSGALRLLFHQYKTVCVQNQQRRCKHNIYRTIDGSCNNLRFKTWGMAETAQRRFAKADFDDDVSVPRQTGSKDTPLPSARLVSNVMHENPDAPDTLDNQRFTIFLPAYGQFLDHDITLTPELEGEEGSTIKCDGIITGLGHRRQCFPIKIPPKDPRFKGRYMEFVRSRPTLFNGVRETVNAITAFVDGSNIYGSSDTLAKQLREGPNGAKMRTRIVISGRSLPRGPDEDCNIKKPRDFCKRAGDIRVNEVSHLSMFHTCFVRQHNNIVHILKSLNRHWNNEKLYQETRKIIGAILQHVTYAEFLPIILDKKVLTKFRLRVVGRRRRHRYSRNVDPSIRTEFSTAAFRFGHSLIQTNQACANEKFDIFFSKKLENDFFDPHLTQKCPAGIARWASFKPCKEMDSRFVGAVKDNLFLDSNDEAFDLVARNLQRGRDHGIPSYNAVRQALRLPKIRSRAQLEKIMGKENARRLIKAYGHIEDIDLFAAGVSELPLGTGILGETFQSILANQFFRLKHGDRFWYETNDRNIKFTPGQLRVIKSVRLSQMMCDCFCLDKLQSKIFELVTRENERKTCKKWATRWTLRPWKERK